MRMTALIPEAIVFVTALLVLLLGVLLENRKKTYLSFLSAVGVIFAVAVEILLKNASFPLYNDILLIDPLSVFFKVFFLVVALFIIVISYQLVEDPDYIGEYFALILFSTLGMMIISSCGELITMYVGLGLVSLPLYALVTRSPVVESAGDESYKGKEAGTKYIILGMLSTAVLLYGLTILYGLTGTLVVKEIYHNLTGPITHPALILSFAFVLMGFGFKIGMVPFHTWVPDIYEGAPTQISAFLSVASKAAGFVLLLRVYVSALAGSRVYWIPMVEILAILTMFLGNLAALSQDNIKRLLAYSSIAHGGYALVGIAVLSDMGISSTLFYLIAYGCASLCAFTAVIVFSNATGSDEIKGYAGLYRRAPGLALALTISLLSLAGIPVFVGFAGKFYIFTSAAYGGLYKLLVFALINGAISLYYYLRIVKEMYTSEPSTEETISVPPVFKVVLWIESIAIVLIGIYPWIFIRITEDVARSFLAGF